MIGHVPHAHQTENHLIDPDYYWVRSGTVEFSRLDSLIDRPTTLWLNNDSSYYGSNDRLTMAEAASFTHSLLLIEPEELHILVRVEGAPFGNGRRKVRARFTYNGQHHSLHITDPTVERRFLGGENGTFEVGGALLCVSLTESFKDGNCYKVVATVLHPDWVVPN